MKMNLQILTLNSWIFQAILIVYTTEYITEWKTGMDMPTFQKKIEQHIFTIMMIDIGISMTENKIKIASKIGATVDGHLLYQIICQNFKARRIFLEKKLKKSTSYTVRLAKRTQAQK